MSRPAFPDDFVWGVATASYQIEGSVRADGRSESIWDRFSHTPGKTRNGETGDVTCDHYRRWREDLALMEQLGVTGYRFSIAWPRVMPEGTGRVNSAGLDFYDRLVDALLEAGIAPYPTLYHWDLPQTLEDRGGWPHRDTALAFADYAGVVADRLGDRVEHWWTVNEPWCVAELGYRSGVHAPGRSDPEDAAAAAHHVLLAHGLGLQAVKASAPHAQVGIVLSIEDHVPRSRHPGDVAAAQLAYDVNVGWYLDPVLLGAYPPAAVAHHEWDQRPVRDGDLDVISSPLDQLGINYYSRKISRADAVVDDERPQPIVDADLPRTTMGWEVYPEGLRDVLRRLNDQYTPPPVYITESGAAFVDDVTDGAVSDEHRRDYLERHFAMASEAIASGVDLRGYFVWTLMDNFEWQHGYGQRFGLVHVDFDTQQRILKDSGRWYASVIEGTQRP